MGRPFNLTLATTLLCSATVAFGHHASAPHFDASRPIEITGVVTEFRFVNPHAYLYLDVTDSDGNIVNWNCEMSSAAPLRRQGWTADLFRPGMSVTIDGNAARRDPHGCAFQSGILEDGTQIARGGQITRGNVVANAVATEESEQPATGTSRSLTGTWITAPRQRAAAGGNRPAGGGGPPGIERFADLLTPAGRAAADNYDERFDDPALQCSPSSIIRGWSEPNGISEITQTDNTITIRHEFMDTVRAVDLTTREHPANAQAGFTGHSVGWFEQDTLVIETAGFAAGVLLPHPGIMHTEDMRILERISLSDDGSQLIREYEVTDPAFMNRAYTGTNRWVRTDLPLPAYECTELSGINNIRPAENPSED